jgi:hypothetical protein
MIPETERANPRIEKTDPRGAEIIIRGAIKRPASERNYYCTNPEISDILQNRRINSIKKVRQFQVSIIQFQYFNR